MRCVIVFHCLLIVACVASQQSANKTELQNNGKNSTVPAPLPAKTDEKIDAKETGKSNVTKPVVQDESSAVFPIDDDMMQSGALMRGFFVIFGITVLLLAYLGFRMLRLRKMKPPVMVRKYGVLASRADVEMLPLPLSEEDDDDTVFDVHNTNRNNSLENNSSSN